MGIKSAKRSRRVFHDEHNYGCLSLDTKSWPGPGWEGQDSWPRPRLILARAKICISLELDFNWSKQIQSMSPASGRQLNLCLCVFVCLSELFPLSTCYTGSHKLQTQNITYDH